MEYFEDLVVDTPLRFGQRLVTREEVIEFAAKFDPQPFHLDDEAASQTYFGRLSASGWHTAAMTMAMIVAQQQVDGHQGMGSPGVEDLRWLRPVYPGDTLTCERVILEKRLSTTRPGLGLFRTRVQTLNQHGEAVMRWTGTAFIKVRGAADGSGPV